MKGMLSRIVASFYWIGRYTERIDYTARLADVNLYGQHQLKAQEDYCHSIMNHLTNARNNVREVRQYASNRMWDSINGFYLWLSEQNNTKEQQTPFKLLNRVRNEVSLFQNVTTSSMLHEVEWGFLNAGEYLERAENTARMILLFLESLDEGERDVHSIDYHQLITLLESVDGVEAFRKIYANQFTLDKIIEFLLLNSVFARSTYFCLFAIEENLKGVKIEYQLDHLAKVIRLVNRLRALLFQSLDLKGKTIMEHREFIHAIISGCGQISQEIERSIAYDPEVNVAENFPRKLAELV